MMTFFGIVGIIACSAGIIGTIGWCCWVHEHVKELERRSDNQFSSIMEQSHRLNRLEDKERGR